MDLAVSRWDGDAPSYLLVHGLASSRRLWDGVGAALGHRAIAVDQRGHGESACLDGDFGSWGTFVADLLAVIEAESLDRPVVVGQSWGASVAIELARRAPGAVSGVACVDGGAVDLGARFPTWEACAAVLAPPSFDGLGWDELRSRVEASHAGWPPFSVDAALACFERRPDGSAAPKLTRERHMEILRLLWSHRPEEALADLTVPVLLLPCRGGAVVKEEAVERALRVLGPLGSVHWFEAHHDVHAQYPEAVAAVLRQGFAA